MSLITPIAFVLLVWWSSTALLMWLARLPVHTHRLSIAGATFSLGVAVALLEVSLARPDPVGAYLGFLAAVLLWGWLEMTYLMGFLTGSERAPCPPGVTGWRRFVRAVNVGLYHEIAIIVVGISLIVISRKAEIAVTAWTFGILWFMRWSAKLNLYFGVANLNDELLPDRMRYMVSYMGRKPMNLLFPVSVSVGTLLVAYHASTVGTAAANGPGHQTAAGLLATIAALGVLEHWLLVLPIKDSALWRMISAGLGERPETDVPNREPGIPDSVTR